MALNINGTTGISGVDGSNASPAIQGTDSNTGVSFGSDTVNINTGGTTRATVDSSGNLNIPNDSGKLQLGTSADLQIYHDGTTNIIEGLNCNMSIRPKTGENGILLRNNGAVELYYDDSKKFETVSAGATVTGNFNVTSRIGINQPPSTNVPLTIESFSSNNYIAEFYHHNNIAVGSITTSSSATAYNTSSDYRLKENVTAISDGITRLKTLKPSRFNFKVDKDTTVDGFLAHEVTAVPEAITGTKDEVDENNEPVYQGIDQSKLVPLLTAALQEAIAKIETLETKVAALEAG